MKALFYFLIISSLTTIYSCSDDITSLPDKQECMLMSFTDSSKYFYSVTYENNVLHKLAYYKYNSENENELIRTVTINRNFFNEINFITYTDKYGNMESIDSVFSDNNGNINAIVHYNGDGNQYSKEIKKYNEFNLVSEENSYKYTDKWELTSSTDYVYDDKKRVIKSIYELITNMGSNIDTTTYTYDNMKNIESKYELFTAYNINNKLTATTIYHLNNGTNTEETKYFEYEYNKEGYPIKVKITSSINQDDVKFKYFNFECPK